MTQQRFRVSFSCEAIIELDQAVIDEVDDEWRSVFYDLNTRSEIAAHIGYNLVIRHRPLSRMDGWAGQPDDNARVIKLEDWEVFGVTPLD